MRFLIVYPINSTKKRHSWVLGPKLFFRPFAVKTPKRWYFSQKASLNIQTIINWINHQEPHVGIDPHEATHDEDADAHEDMAEEHADDAHDEDLDAEQ